MSRDRYRICDNRYPHFLTCTITGWLPVLTRVESRQIILDSWCYLQTQSGLVIYGFVILENHLHWIGKAIDLNDVVTRFKSYTAKQIIELLQRRQATSLLRQLAALKLKYKLESTHQLWQEGSHPKELSSDEMLRQKLEYIHDNPVKRGYVSDPTHWLPSSARNYAKLPGLIEVETGWSR